MQIDNSPFQTKIPQIDQVLVDAQNQGNELANKMLKMNAMQQIDLSQLSYMGTIIDLYT